MCRSRGCLCAACRALGFTVGLWGQGAAAISSVMANGLLSLVAGRYVCIRAGVGLRVLAHAWVSVRACAWVWVCAWVSSRFAFKDSRAFMSPGSSLFVRPDSRRCAPSPASDSAASSFYRLCQLGPPCQPPLYQRARAAMAGVRGAPALAAAGVAAAAAAAAAAEAAAEAEAAKVLAAGVAPAAEAEAEAAAPPLTGAMPVLLTLAPQPACTMLRTWLRAPPPPGRTSATGPGCGPRSAPYLSPGHCFGGVHEAEVGSMYNSPDLASGACGMRVRQQTSSLPTAKSGLDRNVQYLRRCISHAFLP